MSSLWKKIALNVWRLDDRYKIVADRKDPDIWSVFKDNILVATKDGSSYSIASAMAAAEKLRGTSNGK